MAISTLRPVHSGLFASRPNHSCNDIHGQAMTRRPPDASTVTIQMSTRKNHEFGNMVEKAKAVQAEFNHIVSACSTQMLGGHVEGPLQSCSRA